jgi:hypothetical protein
MAVDPADAAEVEKLYEFGERLNEAKDKSQHLGDYEGIIAAVKGQSVKAKQLAAQLIPRFFKHFPSLATQAMSAQFDLVEEDELAIRVQAIRGLPLLCKDTPEYVSKIVDVLGQLLGSGRYFVFIFCSSHLLLFSNFYFAYLFYFFRGKCGT